MREYMPSVLRLGSYATSRRNSSYAANRNNSSTHPALSTLDTKMWGQKWRIGSRDEDLIDSTYLEFGEVGTSDQSHVMGAMPVRGVK